MSRVAWAWGGPGCWPSWFQLRLRIRGAGRGCGALCPRCGLTPWRRAPLGEEAFAELIFYRLTHFRVNLSAFSKTRVLDLLPCPPSARWQSINTCSRVQQGLDLRCDDFTEQEVREEDPRTAGATGERERGQALEGGRPRKDAGREGDPRGPGGMHQAPSRASPGGHLRRRWDWDGE